MDEPSEQRPRYIKVAHRPDSSLFMIVCDEGWRSTIVASGLYGYVADWLLSLIGGRPLPEAK